MLPHRVPDLAGLVFLAAILLFLPLAALKSKRAIDAGIVYPPTTRVLLSTLFLQIAMVALALLAGRGWFDAWAPPADPLRAALLAAGVLALLVATIPWRWRASSPEARRRLAHMMPQSAREWPLYAAVSLAAGISEEICFRGVAVGLVEWWSGSWWLAVLLSATAFAAAHAIQGWFKVGVIFVLALAFHGLVRATGSLLPAMAAHAGYDLIAGAAYGRLTRGLRTTQTLGRA